MAIQNKFFYPLQSSEELLHLTIQSEISLI